VRSRCCTTNPAGAAGGLSSRGGSQRANRLANFHSDRPPERPCGAAPRSTEPLLRATSTASRQAARGGRRNAGTPTTRSPVPRNEPNAPMRTRRNTTSTFRERASADAEAGERAQTAQRLPGAASLSARHAAAAAATERPSRSGENTGKPRALARERRSANCPADNDPRRTTSAFTRLSARRFTPLPPSNRSDPRSTSTAQSCPWSVRGAAATFAAVAGAAGTSIESRTASTQPRRSTTRFPNPGVSPRFPLLRSQGRRDHRERTLRLPAVGCGPRAQV
jgi:hypothetical protein